MTAAGEGPAGAESFHYDVFISYCHAGPDRTWAKWLHASLETYRVPRRLARERGLPRRSPAGVPRRGRVVGLAEPQRGHRGGAAAVPVPGGGLLAADAAERVGEQGGRAVPGDGPPRPDHHAAGRGGAARVIPAGAAGDPPDDHRRRGADQRRDRGGRAAGGRRAPGGGRVGAVAPAAGAAPRAGVPPGGAVRRPAAARARAVRPADGRRLRRPAGGARRLRRPARHARAGEAAGRPGRRRYRGHRQRAAARGHAARPEGRQDPGHPGHDGRGRQPPAGKGQDAGVGGRRQAPGARGPLPLQLLARRHGLGPQATRRDRDDARQAGGRRRPAGRVVRAGGGGLQHGRDAPGDPRPRRRGPPPRQAGGGHPGQVPRPRPGRPRLAAAPVPHPPGRRNVVPPPGRQGRGPQVLRGNREAAPHRGRGPAEVAGRLVLRLRDRLRRGAGPSRRARRRRVG